MRLMKQKKIATTRFECEKNKIRTSDVDPLILVPQPESDTEHSLLEPLGPRHH